MDLSDRCRGAEASRPRVPIPVVAVLTLVLVLIGSSVSCARPAPDGAAPSTSPATAASSAGPTPGTTPGAGASAGCDHPAGRTTVAYRSLPGVDPNLTSVDVYPVAGTCSSPVVMWVHGGGYQTGDKRNQMNEKVALFHERGWTVVSVNYRLTAPGQPGSAQYPDHFDDVATAVAWVTGNIATYGGDPTRVALLGHSAGADIVANVATNPRYLRDHGSDLDALRCAGPLDTEGFDKAAAGVRDPDGEKEQWQVALGNEPDYLRDTSATQLIEPGIGIPPMIGVVRGAPLRQQIESAFLDTLAAHGIASTTIDARTLSHAEVNSRIGDPADTVMTAPIVAFLTECFGPR